MILFLAKFVHILFHYEFVIALTNYKFRTLLWSVVAFSILLFYFHIFEHKPITGLQSTIQLVNLSEDKFIGFFKNYYWSMNTSLAVALHLVAFLPLHSINDTYLRHCQLKIIFRDSVSFRCTPSSWFWMRKHIQLTNTTDSPNLYIICILHITTHY